MRLPTLIWIVKRKRRLPAFRAPLRIDQFSFHTLARRARSTHAAAGLVLDLRAWSAEARSSKIAARLGIDGDTICSNRQQAAAAHVTRSRACSLRVPRLQYGLRRIPAHECCVDGRSLAGALDQLVEITETPDHPPAEPECSRPSSSTMASCARSELRSSTWRPSPPCRRIRATQRETMSRLGRRA